MTHPLRSLLAATLFTALTPPAALAEQAAPTAAPETTAPAAAPETATPAAPTADAVPTGTAVPTAPPVIGDTYHFALTGPEDKPVTDADAPFADKYLLVAFGFTSCPDVCPTTLYEFGEMLKKVKEPDVIQPVFISIDPLRDNSKVLNQLFQPAHHRPHWRHANHRGNRQALQRHLWLPLPGQKSDPA